MKRLGTGLLYLAVGAFLFLFMVVPILSLLLTSLVGEPVNLLRYLVHLDAAGFVHHVLEKMSLRFFREFLVTRRYRRGLLNAVGLAPMVGVAAWGLARPFAARLGRRGKMLGFPLMFGAGAVAVVWSLVWPLVTPHSSLGHLLVPGDHWQLRLLQSLGYCPLVTFASTTLGVAVAFAVARTDMPYRNTIRILSILPLAVPPFLGALAFKNLVGDYGTITRLLQQVGMSLPFSSQSAFSAGFVQAFLFFPFVVLTTAAALDRQDPTLGEAAEVMGARRGFAFWTVHLPVLLPGISAGAFLIFIRSFGDFATLKLLLPTTYPMLVVEAYRDLSGAAYWGGAAMQSTIMIAVILTVLALQKSFVESGSYQTVTGKAGGREKLTTSSLVNYGALVFCILVFAVPLLFLAGTVLMSVAQNWGIELLPPSYTMARYVGLVHDLLAQDSPLFNSFALTIPALFGTTIFAFTVAYLISRSRHWGGQVLDFLTMLPFVVPGVAFAVALIAAFNAPPLALHFTATLVIIAYIVTRVPYGVRSTTASFQQIGTSMEESSKTMGGTGSLTLFKVTLPLVLPGVLAGTIMVFISAMQDVAITLMICPPNWYPASVYVFNAIGEGNVFGASAYGIVLLLLILIPYLLAQRLGGIQAEL